VAIVLLTFCVADAETEDEEPKELEEPPAPEFKPGEEVRLELAESENWVVVYVPSDYKPDRPWPVILCYPGPGLKATTWPFRDITGGKGFIIIGLNFCSFHTGRRFTKPIEKPEAEQAYLMKAMDELKEHIEIDRDVVFIGGFSEGGYAASYLGEMMLGKLAGLIMLSAGRVESEGGPPGKDSIKDKPIFIAVGEKDYEHRKAALSAARSYRSLKADVTTELWPGVEHAVDTYNTKLGQWLIRKGPLRAVKKKLLDAKKAEEAGKLGEAYSMYAQLAAFSETDESCLAGAEAAKALAANADEQFTKAKKAEEEERYVHAAQILIHVKEVFEGSKFAEQADKQLKELQVDPQIKELIEQTEIDTKADALEAKAAAAEKAKKYKQAIKLYEEYVLSFPKASRFKQVSEHLDELKADKDILSKMGAKDCKQWLSLARNYISAGLPEKAEEYLRKVLEGYPGTEWADEAEKLLRQIAGEIE
jgi:predicted esterase